MGKSKLFTIAMTVLLLFFYTLSGSALAKYTGGSGDPNDPYQLGTASDLLALSSDTNDYDKNFVLTADIDLAPNLPGRQIFTAAVIARDTDNSNYDFDGIAFTGVFDGAGHRIINLTIDTNGARSEFVGLFGFITGEIKNLGMENISIISGNESTCIGQLAGWNAGHISSCYAAGSVTAGDFSTFLGGLVGYNNAGGISNCYTTGSVTTGSYSMFVGGISGINYYGTVSDCFSISTVIGMEYYIGALVGENDSGTIDGCYFLVASGPDNDCGEPLTDEQMKQRNSFIGWDLVGETASGSEDFWRMCIDGVSYPLLWWQFNKADFTCPDQIDFADFAIMAESWLTGPPDGNSRCDIAEPPDNFIDEMDLGIFCDNWLD